MNLRSDDRIGFCVYDWAQAVFGNALLLIPVMITDLASKAASPWGQDVACTAKVGEDGEHCALLRSGAEACVSIEKCTWSVTNMACSALNDTCVPDPSNKCCETTDQAAMHVPFFGADVNYKSIFACLLYTSPSPRD